MRSHTLSLLLVLTAGGCDTADLLPLYDYADVEVKPAPLRPWSDVPSNSDYPEFALRAGIEGTVRLQSTITADGAIEDLRAIEGIGGGCEEAAIEALQDERFTPGRVDGHAINVLTRFTATFMAADRSITIAPDDR